VTDSAPDPAVSTVAERTAQHIEHIWIKASIPVISHKRIVEKIRMLHSNYRNLLKPYKSRQCDPAYTERLKRFATETDLQLFDIAICKCIDFPSCRCKLENKVPPAERSFLTDQRNQRKMMIGGVDVTTTKKLVLRQKRQRRVDDFMEKHRKCIKIDEQVDDVNVSATSDEDDSRMDAMDPDFSVTTDTTDSKVLDIDNKQRKKQMRLELPNVAKMCDRYKVPGRCAAAIVSATLQDVGLIHKGDTSMVIDKNKLGRERRKVRKRLQTQAFQQKLNGLYFDGRKDKTRVQTRKGNKNHGRIIVEEHVCLVREPNSEYLGHITPSSGGAESITTGIWDFLKENKVKTEDLMAIGCDGTNVNTGTHRGVIRLLEKRLGRPLQWFVCLLHANELPLRHLITHLDGVTSGPKLFSGPIGSLLPTCEELPVVPFVAIKFDNCPPVDCADLSTDQKYLFNMCKAVETGQCLEDLALQKPGPVVHSRWLTTANRLLRLYVATAIPSENLVELVTYVMTVYAPLWFHIKVRSACTEGSRHMWRLIQFSRYMKPELKVIVDPVIARNGYFCHSENILLAMLADERDHIRELGCRRILAARKENASEALRQFRVPSLNFNARDYIDLVNWNNEDRCEPPMTKHLAEAELQDCVKNRNNQLVRSLPQFPCHTQATERHIRLVTEASAAVCTEQRDGFIRSGIESRKKMKTFDNKAQYRL